MTHAVVQVRRWWATDHLARGQIAAAVTGAVLVLASAGTPARGAVAGLALVAGPGLAAASLLRHAPWQTKVAIGVAATVVVNVAVAQIMLIAGAWSPRAGVATVVLISGGLLVYGLSRRSAGAPPPMWPPSPADALRVEVVRPTELGEAECDLWRAMQRDVPLLDNPFLAPEFARAVGRFHDNARVAVLSRGLDVVGFFPFDQHRFGIGRPIAAGLTDCQGLVHVPELDLDAQELLQGCGLSVFEFDHLVEGQPFFGPHTTARASSPIMDLSGGYEAYEAYLAQTSPKFSRTTRSKARKLGREVGELRLEYEVNDLDTLRHLTSWKSQQYRRTGRSDRFTRPWITALVEHLLDTEGTAFAGTLSMLFAGDQPIAGHFGLRSDTVLAGWFPAYDVRFAKYSPGLIQHVLMAEAAAAAGIRYIDLGKGDREYKDFLKSGELTVAEGRVLRTATGAVAYWVMRAPVRSARTFVTSHPRLFGVADRSLKRYGRVTSARAARRRTAEAAP